MLQRRLNEAFTVTDQQSSSIRSCTVVILRIRSTFSPQKISPFLISPFTAFYQCFCNTIRYCARITFFKTVITFFHRHSGHFQIFYKIISEGSSRHSYRTLYNLDVFFSGINISLLIASEASHSAVATNLLAI